MGGVSEQPSRHRRGVRLEHPARNHGQPDHGKQRDSRRSHRPYFGNDRFGNRAGGHCGIGGRRGRRRGVWPRCSDQGFRRSDSVPGIAGKRPGLVQPAGCGPQQPESRTEGGNRPVLRDQRHGNSRAECDWRAGLHPVDPNSQLVLFRRVPRHHAPNRRGREYLSAYSSAGQQRRAAGSHIQFRRCPKRRGHDASPGEELHQRNRHHRSRPGREHRRLRGADEARRRERPFRHPGAPGYPGRRRIVREHHQDQDQKGAGHPSEADRHQG